VDTRISKQHSGEFDSIVLALAGLKRLGRDSEAVETLSIDEMIPAPGQGALGIQCRSNDAEVRQALIPLHDFRTGICTTAERAFLGALGAGCSVPAAGHCRLIGDGRVQFLGFYGREDGELRRTVREGDADDAVEIGVSVAEELLR
jgi:hydroxymethylbilane synthase